MRAHKAAYILQEFCRKNYYCIDCPLDEPCRKDKKFKPYEWGVERPKRPYKRLKHKTL